MKRDIHEIVTNHIKERYRRKKNSTKALKNSYKALQSLFMDIVNQENPELTPDETNEITKYFDEFLKEGDFKI